jgi:hypothetical protein
MRIRHILAIFTALVVMLSANVYAQVTAENLADENFGAQYALLAALTADSTDAEIDAAVTAALQGGLGSFSVIESLRTTLPAQSIARSLTVNNVPPNILGLGFANFMPNASAAEIQAGVLSAPNTTALQAAAASGAFTAITILQGNNSAAVIAAAGGAFVDASGRATAATTVEEYEEALGDVVASILAADPNLLDGETVTRVRSTTQNSTGG